jgi:hypothetical protein
VPAPPGVVRRRETVHRAPEGVISVLKKLALVAVAVGAVAAVRKRSTGKVEADLWREATSGPDAVSTPTAR